MKTKTLKIIRFFLINSLVLGALGSCEIQEDFEITKIILKISQT